VGEEVMDIARIMGMGLMGLFGLIVICSIMALIFVWIDEQLRDKCDISLEAIFKAVFGFVLFIAFVFIIGLILGGKV